MDIGCTRHSLFVRCFSLHFYLPIKNGSEWSGLQLIIIFMVSYPLVDFIDVYHVSLSCKKSSFSSSSFFSPFILYLSFGCSIYIPPHLRPVLIVTCYVFRCFNVIFIFSLSGKKIYVLVILLWKHVGAQNAEKILKLPRIWKIFMNWS